MTVGPRVTELHCIMPMANIGSVMAHHSKRQHLTSAKRAVPPTAWARAVDVVIAPIIDNIGATASHLQFAPIRLLFSAYSPLAKGRPCSRC